MNENINLVEILKDCPRGTKLYSTLCGEVELIKVSSVLQYPIVIKTSTSNLLNFTEYGQYYIGGNGECLLFPSKENRDWNTFKAKKPKFDPNTLKPFDKVLAKAENHYKWKCVLFSHIDDYKHSKYSCCGLNYEYCIPYNNNTKHLVNTTEEAPDYYKYWED